MQISMQVQKLGLEWKGQEAALALLNLRGQVQASQKQQVTEEGWHWVRNNFT